MSHTPAVRQRHIIELLDARQSLTIRELAAELGVSAMTIHRDLNVLAGSGQLVKTRGGAVLPSRATGRDAAPGSCAMCNRPVPERTAVILRSEQRGRMAACCPHCGLALLEHDASPGLMLVTDFLYHQMVSANDASYLVGSEVTSCCTPGILAFVNRGDAERFRKGFGGKVMGLAEVRHALRIGMSVPVELRL